MKNKKSILSTSYFWIIAISLIVIFFILFTIIPIEFKFSVNERTSRIYFADNISIAHQQLIDKFNREHKGEIEVVPVNLPFTKFSTNERKELLARSLRSKSNRIDVFSVDVIWVPRFARWCEPIDAYFSDTETDCIIKYILKSCYWDSSLYAIPHYMDIGLMYYRSDLIKKLPDATQIERRLQESITWEEFIRLGRRFSGDANPFYLYAADNFEGLICSYVEGLANLGLNIFQGDSLQLNSPGSRKVVQLLADLVHRYKLTPAIVTKYDEYECYLHAFENDAIFFRGWPGFLRHYKDKFAIEKTRHIRKAPLPHFSGGKPAYIFGGWNLMVSRFSTQKEEAVKFIKFLLREENQKLFYETGGYLPVVQSVYDDSLFCENEPDLNFYRNLLENGIHRPYLVEYTKISDIISYYIHLAIQKEMPVSEALQKASALVNTNYVLIK